MAFTKTANVNVRIQENIKKEAEQILDRIGISRATAIDIFYRQIILNQGIPFSLTIPKTLPVRETMNSREFDLMLSSGYTQALQGESYDIEDVFEELEKGL
ncbi:MAG TPA: type II toxin-antitoxin system RelB/DinJ family antitoxin [Lachnospiraceae bacterium]